MLKLKWVKTIPEESGWYWVRRITKLSCDTIYPKIVKVELRKTRPFTSITDPYIEGIGWLNLQQPLEYAGPLGEPENGF